MKYRIVIEGEASSPPPDYVEKLDKIVRQELRFMLGKSWEVVTCEEVLIDNRAKSNGDLPPKSLWRNPLITDLDKS